MTLLSGVIGLNGNSRQRRKAIRFLQAWGYRVWSSGRERHFIVPDTAKLSEADAVNKYYIQGLLYKRPK